MTYKVLEEACIGCGACDYSCPNGALYKTDSFLGLFEIDPYRCDACADCLPKCPLDAIVLDLFEGPAETARADEPLFGAAAIDRVRRALTPGGVYAVWSENPVPVFEDRLARAGFDVERRRPGRGGLRHAVYLARARSAGRKSALRAR